MEFLFWLIIIPIVVIAAIGWLFRYLYKALAKRGKAWIAILIITAVICLLSWPVYMAFYPRDDLYYQNLEKTTFRKTPPSAEILNKSATYPDQHGDYCSAAVIKLSVAAYSKLLNDIQADKRFQQGSPGSSSVWHDVMSGRKTTDIANGFQSGEMGYIGFLNDHQTIVFQFCSF